MKFGFVFPWFGPNPGPGRRPLDSGRRGVEFAGVFASVAFLTVNFVPKSIFWNPINYASTTVQALHQTTGLLDVLLSCYITSVRLYLTSRIYEAVHSPVHHQRPAAGRPPPPALRLLPPRIHIYIYIYMYVYMWIIFMYYKCFTNSPLRSKACCDYLHLIRCSWRVPTSKLPLL